VRQHWLDRLLAASPAPVPLTRTQARREAATTALLVAAMLAYANGHAWLGTRREQELSTGFSFGHMAMLGLSLGWSALARLPPAELGLGRRGLGRSLGWGLLVGGVASLIIRFFFAFPLVTRRAVTQPEFAAMSQGRLLRLICVQFFLGSAVFEEVAFRGLLHAKLVRLLGVRRALLAGSGVFTAWHLVIAWHNVRRSNLPRVLFPFVYGLVLAALYVGGLLFAVLRQGTGHLAGAILAHWLMVANIAWAVARPRRGGSP
jgi:membrane protease YdiL (CAAX protease family)